MPYGGGARRAAKRVVGSAHGASRCRAGWWAGGGLRQQREFGSRHLPTPIDDTPPRAARWRPCGHESLNAERGVHATASRALCGGAAPRRRGCRGRGRGSPLGGGRCTAPLPAGGCLQAVATAGDPHAQTGTPRGRPVSKIAARHPHVGTSLFHAMTLEEIIGGPPRARHGRGAWWCGARPPSLSRDPGSRPPPTFDARRGARARPRALREGRARRRAEDPQMQGWIELTVRPTPTPRRRVRCLPAS